MATLVKDRRGSIVVQFALLLPIIVVIILMTFEVWQVVSVKKALHMAAYQAARYIGAFPQDLREKQNLTTAQEARTLILENLSYHPLIGDRLEDVQIYISPLGWECGEEFEISVAIEWEVGMPIVSRLWRGVLESHYLDYIQCRE